VNAHHLSTIPHRTSVYPEILAQEFDDFASLMKDPFFPDTYQRWIDRVRHEVEGKFRYGFVINPRKVHPDEFERWCRAQGIAPSFVALWRFALWKAEKHRG
jgi:hypothetical protein